MSYVDHRTGKVKHNAVAAEAKGLFDYTLPDTEANPATDSRKGQSVADRWTAVLTKNAQAAAASTPTEGDSAGDRAAGFLRKIARDGLIALAAIVPDGGAPSGVTFDTSTEGEKIAAWINANEGR